jgi:predicted nucleic acid-binding Zn ribbon protein
MERKQEKRIGSLLDEFVKSNNLQKGLAEYRITKAWNELLGKRVALATKSLYIKDHKLFVSLHSSVLRNELSMIKDDLIRRLNEAARAEVITDIVIR